MLVGRIVIFGMMLVLTGPRVTPLQAQINQESLNATMQLYVDNIKAKCNQRYPEDEQQFRKCAVNQYKAMTAFFSKLFHYRDTKGTRSNEFKRGVECLERASPAVQEQQRKVAVEHADWIRANNCYETAIR